MTKRRQKGTLVTSEDCTPMMDYAPTLMECAEDGILHGATDYGNYGDIHIATGSTCQIPGCNETCGKGYRYCNEHRAFGRYCKARTRHQMRVVRRILAERKEERHGTA